MKLSEINHNEENTRSSQFVKSALHDDPLQLRKNFCRFKAQN